MSYIAFVPARSGSKRLPNKNVKLLAGKPLVAWTLEACARAGNVNKVIFSTDSMEYWDIAQRHVDPEKLVLDYRSSDEAGDNVKIFDYLKDGHAKIFGDVGGAFILALPTVPLRHSQHVDEAIAMFERERRPVFSATSYGFPITFAFRIDEQGEWSPVFEDTPLLNGNTRSQNQPAAYHPNGAIYVRSIADLARSGLRSLFEGAKPYLMDPLDSVDIDGEPDFAIAAALLEARTAARS